MKKIVHGFESLNGRISLLWAALVIPLMLCTVIEVVARYFFNDSQLWVHDLSLHLLMGIAMLSGAYALQVGGHVKVDILYERFPRKMQVIVDIITSLMGLSFVAILTWQGWEFAYSALEKNIHGPIGTMGWPVFPIRLMIPIGAFLVCLQFIAKIYHHVEILLGNDKPSTGN